MPQSPLSPRTITTAVVTGPTGAVGLALCTALLAQGVSVAAVVRPGSPRAAALPNHPNLRVVPCALSALQTLPNLLPAPVDAFFHLGWAGTTGAGRQDMPAQIANISAAVSAARAAAALGCAVFVGVGSQAEYGPAAVPLRPDTPAAPQTGYGMAKLCAGQMTRAECRRLGLAHVWVRLLSVYGPHDGPGSVISIVIRQLLAGQCPALTAGEQRWDYLYAADAADALCRCALTGRDGAVYPLGSGSARLLRSYLQELRDAVDPALPLGFGQIAYPPGQPMLLQADLTALHRDTGFVPTTPFADGIRQTIDWVRKEK